MCKSPWNFESAAGEMDDRRDTSRGARVQLLLSPGTASRALDHWAPPELPTAEIRDSPGPVGEELGAQVEAPMRPGKSRAGRVKASEMSRYRVVGP
jgi:hypothetical protein